MLVGHTKFGPDRFLVYLRGSIRSPFITICDIEHIVKESTQNNQKRAQLVESMDGVRKVCNISLMDFISFTILQNYS